MALIDQIIGVESGGNPNATNPNSSAMGAEGSFPHVGLKCLAYARISELFFGRSPSAVFWTVMPVAISSFNGMTLGWLLAHVSKKVLETIAPTHTNLDAASPVPLVGNMVFVFASRDHSAPRMVFASSGYALRKPSRSAVGDDSVSASTAASRCVARPEVGDGYNLFYSAITNATHLADCAVSILSNLRRSFGNSGQFSEFRSDAVYGGCH